MSPRGGMPAAGVRLGLIDSAAVPWETVAPLFSSLGVFKWRKLRGRYKRAAGS